MVVKENHKHLWTNVPNHRKQLLMAEDPDACVAVQKQAMKMFKCLCQPASGLDQVNGNTI